MDNKTGGPAFPLPEAAHPGANPPDVPKGMTLRDYFAAKAMQAFIVRHGPDGYTATNSYVLADDMLAEREKRNG